MFFPLDVSFLNERVRKNESAIGLIRSGCGLGGHVGLTDADGSVSFIVQQLRFLPTNLSHWTSVKTTSFTRPNFLLFRGSHRPVSLTCSQLSFSSSLIPSLPDRIMGSVSFCMRICATFRYSIGKRCLWREGCARMESHFLWAKLEPSGIYGIAASRKEKSDVAVHYLCDFPAMWIKWLLLLLLLLVLSGSGKAPYETTILFKYRFLKDTLLG